MNDNIESKDTWKLDKIELELKTYGEDEGKYVGRVRFGNGHCETFSFRIRPAMADRYVELIADDLVRGASRLSDDLLKSLGLKKKRA